MNARDLPIRCLAFLALLVLSGSGRLAAPRLNGAWRLSSGPKTLLLTVSDSYLMWTEFAPDRFVETRGGTWHREGRDLKLTIEFDSRDTATVGKTELLPLVLTGNRLTLGTLDFERVDEPTADTPLAGLWRITGREGDDGQMAAMPRGDRKTLKLLTGTRFQWAAINPKTRQFSGTGGGTYMLANGKYTETIDFFSRDNSRVGRSLTFDCELKGDNRVADRWHHRGQSSTGGKVSEVWSREK
jgi:hypothetical protein